ncbi:MAG: hypothetical protein C4589_04965 [Peptococcaceae bacterium]|nr:MAG: hypothetical protein C4589_04965 [Peptococcaceae bacterium]
MGLLSWRGYGNCRRKIFYKRDKSDKGTVLCHTTRGYFQDRPTCRESGASSGMKMLYVIARAKPVAISFGGMGLLRLRLAMTGWSNFQDRRC